MRWFKHLTRSHEDEKLCRLRDRFGSQGYGIWWLVLERIAGEMEGADPIPSLELSFKNWSKSCGISVKKFQLFVSFLSDFENVSVTISGQFCKIEVPNLLKYRDEYSKKSGHKTPSSPDSVRSKIQIQKQSTDTDPPLTPQGGDPPPPKSSPSKPKKSEPKTDPWDFSSKLDSWKSTYPKINIENEIAKCRAWWESHPEKVRGRKRPEGTVCNWLARANDRAPDNGPRTDEAGNVWDGERWWTGEQYEASMKYGKERREDEYEKAGVVLPGRGSEPIYRREAPPSRKVASTVGAIQSVGGVEDGNGNQDVGKTTKSHIPPAGDEL